MCCFPVRGKQFSEFGKGIVKSKTQGTIVIGMNPFSYDRKDTFRLDKGPNETAYQRMKTGLSKVCERGWDGPAWLRPLLVTTALWMVQDERNKYG